MTNRFAIVTGTSRGIGFAVAKYLAESGYDVAMIARTSERLAKAKGHLY
jgi:short-subunit dehydrogenase